MTIETLEIILASIIIFIMCKIFIHIVFPKIIYASMKEVERNPRWITSQLQSYYGLNDIDIVLYESKLNALPYVRIGKQKQLELWITNNTSTKDVENVGQVALALKIKCKYNLWFPDKPLYWLSILCYMLDGGDIQMTDLSPKETQKK